jgi:CRP/FNR family transcriptional regulator, nitrogen oxide reductase regulator
LSQTSTLDLLRAIPLFRALPAEDLAQVPVSRIELGRGESLFHQEEPAAAVFGVLSGRIRVVKQSLGGREVCLEILGPGEPIAAIAVMRNIPYPASGIATEATACARVPAEAFKLLVKRHPSVAARVLEIVSQRLLDASESRLSLATEPVETRLAQTLLKLAEKYASRRGEERVFGTSFTRQQLADLAGTTVETAIRVMSRWTRDGILRSCESRITIVRPQALERAAGRCPVASLPRAK